jgi:hypothetical protein
MVYTRRLKYMKRTKSLTKGQAEAFPQVAWYTCSFCFCFKLGHVKETLKYLTSRINELYSVSSFGYLESGIPKYKIKYTFTNSDAQIMSLQNGKIQCMQEHEQGRIANLWRLTMLCLELAVIGLRKDLTFWFFPSKWSMYLLQASQAFWIREAPLPAMATEFCIF